MPAPIPMDVLPALNASLNGATACLITTGFVMIKRGNVKVHKRCMITACLLSVIFLASYITYHFGGGGFTRYPSVGVMRMLYISILTSHTILAVITLPLVIITVILALRQKFEKHKKLARWTFPIWLYVSVTGVIIYLMLYQLPGGVGS